MNKFILLKLNCVHIRMSRNKNQFNYILLGTKMKDVVEHLEVTVLNWEKYNPPSDRVRHKHWFRINHNIATSNGLWGLSPGQRWFWVVLLSECCRKNSATIQLTPSRFSALCGGLQKHDILQAIDILVKNGTLSVSCQSTDSPLTTHNITVHNITEHNITKKSFELRHPSNLEVASQRSNSRVTGDCLGFVESLSLETRNRIKRIYPEEAFINREVEKMGIWLEANPSKKPRSRAGWSRFVMGWLERGWERERKVATMPKRMGVDTDWEYIFGKKEEKDGQ